MRSYYIKGSCILVRWSYGLHLGWDTAVCSHDIGNTGDLVPYMSMYVMP